MIFIIFTCTSTISPDCKLPELVSINFFFTVSQILSLYSLLIKLGGVQMKEFIQKILKYYNISFKNQNAQFGKHFDSTSITSGKTIMDSQVSGFYKKSMAQKQQLIASFAKLNSEDMKTLQNFGALNNELTDVFIEIPYF